MKTLTLRTIGGIFLAAASATLVGCPPEDQEAPPEQGAPQVQPEVHDFKDYWPFQVGNLWHLSSLYEEDTAFEYEVKEEYAGKEASGWRLTFRKVTKIESQRFERDEYLILLDGFVFHTFDKDRMHEVLEDPKNAQSVPIVSEFSPRYFVEGTNEIVGMPLYDTLAGHLKSITPFVECDDVRSEAEDFPIPSDTKAMMLMDKGYCSNPQDPFRSAPGFGFGKDIGIIYYYGHVLSYAYVDGVEYSFQP